MPTENKCCKECKHWERSKHSSANNGDCNFAPLPHWVFVGAHDNYMNEEDGSDCNAFQSREIINEQNKGQQHD